MAAVMFAMSLAPTPAIAQTSGLEIHRGKNRVLVIAVERFDQIALARQKQVLREGLAGLRDRDIVAFAMTRDAIAGIVGDVPARPVTVPGSPGAKPAFEAILIGKDGGIKKRWRAPVSLEALFAVIDAMPMRRQEMGSGS